MTSPWLTKEEAAEYARVHPATIDRARKNGDLEWGGPPGKILFLQEWLDAWILRQRNGNRSED